MNLDWFLFRVMFVFSPLPLIGGLALLIQGQIGGLLLIAIAAVMFTGGRRTRGQRTPP